MLVSPPEPQRLRGADAKSMPVGYSNALQSVVWPAARKQGRWRRLQMHQSRDRLKT